MDMQIFRIEDESGIGAFRSGLADVHDSFGGTSRRGPGPWEETWLDLEKWEKRGKVELYWPERNWTFGCESKLQLRTWFNHPFGIQEMSKKGALLATYEVGKDYVIRGVRQALFFKPMAKLVTRQPAKKLLAIQTKEYDNGPDNWEA